jgi:hypothetical protein
MALQEQPLDASSNSSAPSPSSSKVSLPSSSLTSASDTPSSACIQLDILKKLVLLTEKHNERGRKMNSLRRSMRDSSEDSVSDDEEEDTLDLVVYFNGRPRAASEAQSNQPSRNISLVPSPSAPSASSTTTQTALAPPPLVISPPASTQPSTIVNAPNTAPGQSFNLAKLQSLLESLLPTYIDYRNLPPLYTYEELKDKKLQLYITTIPDAILHMAFNRVYIPLSLLTPCAMDRIRCNQNLRAKKMYFGHGAGQLFLDHTNFPHEDSLSKDAFLQAYHQWLSIINRVADAELAVGWRQHFHRMLAEVTRDSFAAWRIMDKQLRSQFVVEPFILRPNEDPTYHTLFMRAHYDTFTPLLHLPSGPPVANSTQQPADPASSSQVPTRRYSPYRKNRRNPRVPRVK